jgi:hypothetical protein
MSLGSSIDGASAVRPVLVKNVNGKRTSSSKELRGTRFFAERIDPSQYNLFETYEGKLYQIYALNTGKQW